MSVQQRNNRNRMLLLFLNFFIFIFVISFISAQPFVQESEKGLIIEYNKIFSIKQSEDITFWAIPNNESNGLKLDNTEANCFFHLADDKGDYLIRNEEMLYSSPAFYYNASGTNFSELGTYTYGVDCNTSTSGGFVSVEAEVTPSGYQSTENIIFYVVLIFGLFTINLLGFFKRNATITILGGIGLTFLGLYMLENGIIIFRDNLTLAVSYITLFWGVGSSLWAAVETIEENM